MGVLLWIVFVLQIYFLSSTDYIGFCLRHFIPPTNDTNFTNLFVVIYEFCGQNKNHVLMSKIKRQEKSSYKIHPQMTQILQIYLW